MGVAFCRLSARKRMAGWRSREDMVWCLGFWVGLGFEMKMPPSNFFFFFAGYDLRDNDGSEGVVWNQMVAKGSERNGILHWRFRA